MKEIEDVPELRRVLESTESPAFTAFLLATRQDPQYAYVRNNWRDLDRATGNSVRMFVFVEREPVLNSHLVYALTIASMAHGSSAAYDLARELGVKQASMPCIVLYAGRLIPKPPIIVVPLPAAGELTKFLRIMFDNLGASAAASPSERLGEFARRRKRRKALKILTAPIGDLLSRLVGSKTAALTQA